MSTDFAAATEEALVTFLKRCSMERGIALNHDEAGVDLEVEEWLGDDEVSGFSTWDITKARFERTVFEGMTHAETVAAMLAVLDAESAHSIKRIPLVSREDGDDIAGKMSDAASDVRRDLGTRDVLLGLSGSTVKFLIDGTHLVSFSVAEALEMGVDRVAESVIAEHLKYLGC